MLARKQKLYLLINRLKKGKKQIMGQNELTGYPSIDKPWLKYYSTEAINAILPQVTIYEYLVQNNKDYLDNIALCYFSKRITYGELFENIVNVATAFSDFGIQQQDIVSVCLPNIPEAVYIFYGLNYIGAVCNFLDPRASESVMKEHLNLARAKLLVTIPDKYKLFKKLQKESDIESIVVVDVLQSINTTFSFDIEPGDMQWNTFMSVYQKESCLCVNHNCMLPVCILHTGGTTGTPKGAVLTDYNFHSLVSQWKYLDLYYQRGSILLSLMPPFVSFGLAANLHVPLSFGMQIILIPEYNPEKTVDLIKEFRPNCIPASPAHWEAVFNNPEIQTMDLSFLKFAFVGGDTLNIKIEQGLNQTFAQNSSGLKMRKGYGMTETTTCLTMTSFNVTNFEKSVGIPLPQTIVGIFDENQQELPYNRVGEICVQTKNTMTGYYNNDKETAETIRIHNDGTAWLHTGDMGEITPEGILYIKGRIKRIIIRYDGIKIYPVDVESKILENPLVENCAVVAAKDPLHIQGDIPVAYIVLKNDEINTEIQESVKDYCKKHIIDYAVPQMFYYMNKLPYTRNGKIDFIQLERHTENSLMEKTN